MPPPASTQAPGIPPALDAVIERALAKDPNTRHPSAGDLARAAHGALSGYAVADPERSVARGAAATRLEDPPTLQQAPRPPSPPPPPQPPPAPDRDGGLRPRTLIALIAAALVLAGGGVAAALALSGGGDDGTTQTGARTPTRVTVTERDTSGPATTRTSTTVTTPTTTTSGGAPVNATSCSSGLSVGPQTSCAFAENVRRAYYRSGGGSGTIEAHSPTTGRDYELRCSEGATTVCITTDTGAKVYIS
jgi:serine/threonine-protein kinase